MNWMRIVRWCVLVILCVSLVAGCFLFDPLASYLGRLLKTDENGHLTEEITYRNGSYVYTLRPDGTYEATTESFEESGEDADNDGVPGEGWVSISGSRGTYTWDATWCHMEWTETSELVNGEWVAITDPVTYSRGFFLTDQTYGIAWSLESEVNATLDIFEVTYADGTSEVTSTELEWGESGSTEMRIFEVYSESDADNNVLYEEVTRRDGDLVVYPEGTRMRPGDAFTFQVTVTATTYPDGSWSGDRYYYTRDFFNAGRFYIEWIEGTAQRGFLGH